MMRRALLHTLFKVSMSVQAYFSVSSSLADKFLGVGEDEDEGEDEEGGLFDFSKLQTQLTESLNSGYLLSTKSLRETLLAHEWEMHGKHTAQRRWVGAGDRGSRAAGSRGGGWGTKG